ncbi:MAG: hydrogenase maturation protease [Bryobacteraceae bacterium]
MNFAPAPALVIGYGNDLRGDDGAGPAAVRQLQANAGQQSLLCHQLTPELAEAISRYASVIFVDARADLPPGEVRIEPLDGGRTPLTQKCSPGALLTWSRQIYGREPAAFAVGIGAESFEFGEGLTPVVRRAACEAARAIERMLKPPGAP